MLDTGAIRLSFSLWFSAVMLVRKKDGKLFFWIDLRKLNQMTIKDACSIPCIQETLDCLKGVVWFTSSEMKSRYWQVKMPEESKAQNAFIMGLLGSYECKHMLFRLTNAPTTFQCLMEMCQGELQLIWCIIYLGDIVIFAETYQKHLWQVRAMFLRLRKAGLKLMPNKCDFFTERWSI